MTLRRFLQILEVDYNKEKIQEILDYQIEFHGVGVISLSNDETFPVNSIIRNNENETIILNY